MDMMFVFKIALHLLQDLLLYLGKLFASDVVAAVYELSAFIVVEEVNENLLFLFSHIIFFVQV